MNLNLWKMVHAPVLILEILFVKPGILEDQITRQN